MSALKRIIITPGEPAGIGPEITVKAAQTACPDAQLVACCDPDLLAKTAEALKLPLTMERVDWQQTPCRAHQPGSIFVDPVPLQQTARPGHPDPGNADYVLESLTLAVDRIQQNSAHALVTGPVNKAIINEGGIPFSGHTEFLQQYAKCPFVVMMLATEGLRVALATTHIPLSKVPAAITRQQLMQTIRVLSHDLQQRFAIPTPRIGVCGLNPHAGEQGYLGREEIDVINPVLESFQEGGLAISHALPADTLFTPRQLAAYDCILAMYHDQGLCVLKHKGFEQATNITLGLPFIRTSVDHGSAIDIAGKNMASPSSLHYSIQSAIELSQSIHL